MRAKAEFEWELSQKPFSDAAKIGLAALHVTHGHIYDAESLLSQVAVNSCRAFARVNGIPPSSLLRKAGAVWLSIWQVTRPKSRRVSPHNMTHRALLLNAVAFYEEAVRLCVAPAVGTTAAPAAAAAAAEGESKEGDTSATAANDGEADNKPAHEAAVLLEAAIVYELMGRMHEALALHARVVSEYAEASEVGRAMWRSAALLTFLGDAPKSAVYWKWLIDAGEDGGIPSPYSVRDVTMLMAKQKDDLGDFMGASKFYKRLVDELSADPPAPAETCRHPYCAADDVFAADTNRVETASCWPSNKEGWRAQPQPFLWLATKCVRNCDYALAVVCLNEASERRRSSADIHLAAGWLLFLLGDVDGACAEEESALSINPESEEARELLLFMKPGEWGRRLLIGSGPSAPTTPQSLAAQIDRERRGGVADISGGSGTKIINLTSAVDLYDSARQIPTRRELFIHEGGHAAAAEDAGDVRIRPAPGVPENSSVPRHVQRMMREVQIRLLKEVFGAWCSIREELARDRLILLNARANQLRKLLLRWRRAAFEIRSNRDSLVEGPIRARDHRTLHRIVNRWRNFTRDRVRVRWIVQRAMNNRHFYMRDRPKTAGGFRSQALNNLSSFPVKQDGHTRSVYMNLNSRSRLRVQQRKAQKRREAPSSSSRPPSPAEEEAVHLASATSPEELRPHTPPPAPEQEEGQRDIDEDVAGEEDQDLGGDGGGHTRTVLDGWKYDEHVYRVGDRGREYGRVLRRDRRTAEREEGVRNKRRSLGLDSIDMSHAATTANATKHVKQKKAARPMSAPPTIHSRQIVPTG